ncbi:MAG: 8-amino-7-oxononanoate synthase [Marinoscillum sp.]
MKLDFLLDKLDERKKRGNLRQLKPTSNLIDFVSNDYLGLSQNEALSHRIKTRLHSESIPNGGTGSRLLSGNHGWYHEAEEMLTKVLKSESVLLFNSGYAANQALVSAVADKGDTILYDLLSHVCLKEGAWLSRADSIAYRHNDLEDLESRLKRVRGRCFVLTESVFSMDGDIAPLEDIINLCEQYGAYLIVDEAHSTGALGEGGGGMLVEERLQDRVFARVYTFGKAMGVHGACVAGSQILTEYLINFGRPFIYTTSLPPHSVISITESFKFLGEHMSLQDELKSKISLFQSNWASAKSNTAIQPVMIGNNEKARKISSDLQLVGYDVRPILSPTVGAGTERLRISLHVHNDDQQILSLCIKLNDLIKEST